MTTARKTLAGTFQLDTNLRKFSRANALAMAEAAELAYDEPDVIRRKVTEEWGLKDFYFIESMHMQAYVAQLPDAVLVAFRGTDDPRDWMTNLKTEFIELETGRVHWGFHEALDKMKARVLKAAGTAPVFLTGHSLGGALAMLMTGEFAQHNIELAGLYTFGQPKVGDRVYAHAFDEAFKGKTFRFVNNNDAVPRLPAGKGYHHAGTQMYFGVSGKLYREPSRWLLGLHTAIGWGIMLADWIDKRAFRFATLEAYADHAMRWYLANLRNLEETPPA